MINEGIYSISELSKLLKEDTEFKPKLGDGVTSKNKKNNREAIKKILDDADELNDGVKSKKRTENPQNQKDYNGGMTDWRFDSEPSKDYKDRVEKLATDGTEKDKADYFDTEGNKEFYKDRKEVNKEKTKAREEINTSGLQSQHLNKGMDYKMHTMTESRPTKRLHFKNTVFLSEAQVLSRVPEDYKVHGNKFYMRDASGTDYLIECKVDSEFGYAKLEILNKMNKKEINEQLNRMQSLYEYDRNGSGKSSVDKSNESNLHEQLNIIRDLGK